ncbi:MAG: adenosylcobinamide-phosphate synthase CbiB [Gammaproteobacteria bacterium]|nr:adenosylcobinamide-phosphate synthase CbiB [Gammaproteobacteria bacterium]
MFIETTLILFIALLIDSVIGDPRRYHPLSGFGHCANWLERKLNDPSWSHNRVSGIVSLLVLVLPFVLLVYWLRNLAGQPWLIDVLVVYFAIGRKSLIQHARAVMVPLQQGQLETAREKVAMIVSRDTGSMQEHDVLRAGLESIIENSNDAIFGAIFWYLLAGVEGVLVYRLVNTLDAMWGYKTNRFMMFGWAAAKFDDLLNWLPSRLTVFTFAILSGHLIAVIKTSFRQGRACSSPNAGPVMAAGASALAICLGGAASYHGQVINKPVLGFGAQPVVADLERAMNLVNQSVVLWLFVFFVVAVIGVI